MNSNYKEDVASSLAVLREGGLLLYPTDTIWGLGCDATNEEAVKKIFELKKRSESKSLLVLLESPHKLRQYVAEVPELAYDMIELSESPLTLILDGAKNLANSVVATDGSVGIRIVKEPFLQELLRQLKKPLISTSANISGEPAPAIFSQIKESIKTQVDYVVQYRQEDSTVRPSSHIIKLGVGGEVKVLR